jgi:PAS domain-containing protein
MDDALRILILEDNKNDADLLQRELKKSRLVFISEIVETRDAFENALDHFKPNIILSDYNLSSFDEATVFLIKEKKCPTISGAIGEENALGLIKKGGTDYTIKDRLFALPPKITRALKEAKEKKENKQAKERFNLATRVTNDIIYEWKINDDAVWWNDVYYNLMGIKKEKRWSEYSSWTNSIHPDDRDGVMNSLSDFLESKEFFWSGEYRYLDNKGKVYYFYDKGYLLRDQNGKPIRMVGAIANVTNLKDHITRLKEMVFMTSHRVRLPIANIIGLSDTLDESINNPVELKKIVDYMKQSAISLEEFTHELNHFIQNSKDEAEIEFRHSK